MKKLLPALILGAFAFVQVPAFAQTAKTAAPAASAASAAKSDAKKAGTTTEKAAPRKEKKGGC